MITVILSLVANHEELLLRDPFHISKHSVSSDKKSIFLLKGIVQQEDRYGALIKYRKQIYTVFNQEVCADFIVDYVKSNEVCLRQGEKRIILKLDHRTL